MRIVLISQDDPFYIKEFFEPFLAGCPEEIEIRAAVLCRTMGKSRRTLAAELWRFYGPIDFVRMGLRYTWILMRAAVARKRPVRLPQLFEHHGIPVIETLNVNGRKLREQLESIAPDLIVSVAAPQVFKQKLLELPRMGCINIHTARLPQYRGMMPNFWNLYHDERSSAITIHTMDVDIDRGEILMQKEFEIDPRESLDRLIKRTKRLGAECMLECLSEIARRGFEPVEPPDVEPSYFSFPTREHVREFRRKGYRLL